MIMLSCALSKRRSVFARLSLQLFLLKTICRSSLFKQVFIDSGYFYLLDVKIRIGHDDQDVNHVVIVE